ncbi:YlbF family regulator [Gottschalkia purinilytica]|nr:YlbF family regulator [Gottschalkia purinilytica]
MIKISPLDKARELGNSISQSDEYTNLRKAEEAFHNDNESVKLLKDLEVKKKKYESLISSDNINNKIIKSLFEEIKDIEKKIANNLIIQNLYDCQLKYDKLIKNVNTIIGYMIGSTAQSKSGRSGCKGSCSGCKK